MTAPQRQDMAKPAETRACTQPITEPWADVDAHGHMRNTAYSEFAADFAGVEPPRRVRPRAFPKPSQAKPSLRLHEGRRPSNPGPRNDLWSR
jgi:hypothetical protein